MLQIPNEIVRNENGIKLDERAFCVYAYLCYMRFRSGGKFKININHHAIKNLFNIKDNSTLKNHFKKLYNNGLIVDEVKVLPSHKQLSIQIELSEKCKSNQFTQLPADLLYFIPKIGCAGFKLLYYYESYIDRTKPTKDYAYPAMETIKCHLKIGNDKIIKYNKLLSDCKLLKVTKHEVQCDDLDNYGLIRYNNHYKVRIDRMIKEEKRE